MASRAGSKMEAVVASWRLNGINVGDLKHGVYSPPESKYIESDFDTVQGIDRLRQEAVDAHKFLSNGQTGCLPIVHPWRQCHDDGSTCEDHNCKLHHLWYFSPHVHLIYTGFLKESTQLYHSKKFQGSIFKRIPDAKKRILSLLSSTSYLTLRFPSMNLPGKMPILISFLPNPPIGSH